ncbi:MAG: 1-acyl-sn-glycerol-3-phosphate acyltransferase [Planctomycetes bacterium]|nr:1-acyl-sn-glycerol-3-phosphate acyltransferase [Planctomycetota bacterium]
MTDRPLSSHVNPALARRRLPEGTPPPGAWYRANRRLLRVWMPLVWRMRVFNRHYEPSGGGAVYMCNHQSFMDPVLMSMALQRPMHYMARDSLFRHRLFRLLIESLNAFPVRRGTADTAALKEAMRRVRRGEQVVLFPEGTRTRDGRIGPFLPGVAFVAQRAKATVVPVVIDGAFECWPRTRPLPRPGEIVVRYGRPYTPDEARAMSPDAFVAAVRRDMIAIQADTRRRLGRPPLAYEA